ncbi:MAG: GNAT family N-acetyltransferase [Sediminicola sp.]
MEITFTQANGDQDLNMILDLQMANHYSNLNPEEKSLEGFVTVRHDFRILKEMNRQCAHILAKHKERVVGYALCMHPTFADSIPVLRPMFREIVSVLPKERSFIAMGQVCVDREYRKMGLFRKLYQTMQLHTKDRFDCIITEVDAKNQRSLQAHLAIGFQELKRYSAGDTDWVVIILQN